MLADVIARLPVEVHIYSQAMDRHDEPVRQQCMARLVDDLLKRQAHRLVIDSRSNKDVHDQRTLRRLLGPHPSASELVYEHLDSVKESDSWLYRELTLHPDIAALINELAVWGF